MKDKVILITGATGSLGEKLVERILKEKPGKVIVFSRDEHKQVELKRRFAPDDHPIRYFIGDIRDRDRLTRAFKGVDIVIHAAAMKHVDVCHYNPFEAIRTNVLGAQNIIDAAMDCGVKKVLALSSDKAVNPINLYGATKLCADFLFLTAESYAGAKGCRFAVMRPGNFAGSRGSVIPFFESLRASGKKVFPITHLDATRYFIGLDRVTDLIVKAVGQMTGGEIFVPRMECMKITDIARRICPEAEFEEIGLRPGEKVHEELWPETDLAKTTATNDFFVTRTMGGA